MARDSVRPEVAQDALARAHWRCERCATTAHPYAGVRLEVHHVLGRQPVELVNEPENLLVLCKRFGREPGCHDWWHAHKRRALAWFVEQFGEERLERLRAIQRGTKAMGFAAGGVPSAGRTGESPGCVVGGRPMAARRDSSTGCEQEVGE